MVKILSPTKSQNQFSNTFKWPFSEKIFNWSCLIPDIQFDFILQWTNDAMKFDCTWSRMSYLFITNFEQLVNPLIEFVDRHKMVWYCIFLMFSLSYHFKRELAYFDALYLLLAIDNQLFLSIWMITWWKTVI